MRQRGRRRRIAELLDSVLPRAEAAALFPDGEARAGRLVAASYNIHKCVGTDGRFDPDRILQVIRELDADVLALQEADRRLGIRQGLLDLTRIEKEAGLTLVPVAVRPASHGWHGNAIFVRAGTAMRVKRLTLPYAEPRGAVMAELDLPGGRLRVVAAHLGLLRQSRRQQAAALVQAIDRSDPMPTVLMGDFNEWRPGRPDSPLAELEPLFGPALQSHPSFPSRRPIFALDRILGWPHGTVETTVVHQSPLARVASDHLPVRALVNLTVPLPTGDASAPVPA
ncbi:endonuclease/exonuclease/phosphatase family protein [Chthonobacter rhizosphaerae]|uniref:endonuclease/exonuclease/phosphatase family protein n=1 Tax=Chthonobacter rhizosphaerae TaxID=2735553 RepID=UPI001FE36B4E|nr:endonuclease/exonuclease/phosphatase family protein [Chthonobacter rhizosphaerae]